MTEDTSDDDNIEERVTSGAMTGLFTYPEFELDPGCDYGENHYEISIPSADSPSKAQGGTFRKSERGLYKSATREVLGGPARISPDTPVLHRFRF